MLSPQCTKNVNWDWELVAQIEAGEVLPLVPLPLLTCSSAPLSARPALSCHLSLSSVVFSKKKEKRKKGRETKPKMGTSVPLSTFSYALTPHFFPPLLYL